MNRYTVRIEGNRYPFIEYEVMAQSVYQAMRIITLDLRYNLSRIQSITLEKTDG